MKTRVISSFVGTTILFIAMFLPVWGFMTAIAIVMLLGVTEYWLVFHRAGHRVKAPIFFIGAVAAIPIWISTFQQPLESSRTMTSEGWILIWVLSVGAMCVGWIILSNNRFTIHHAALTIFGILYVVLPITLMVSIRMHEGGRYLIWLVFLGAWITDTGAFFGGMFFGKKKILPTISPKKTWAGFFGGIFTCIIVLTLYGFYLQSVQVDAAWYSYSILGMFCGVFAQAGDWFASAIKRTVKIKDFGNIMPGHGGVLDRFDSVLGTAPLIYVFVMLIL